MTTKQKLTIITTLTSRYTVSWLLQHVAIPDNYSSRISKKAKHLHW